MKIAHPILRQMFVWVGIFVLASSSLHAQNLQLTFDMSNLQNPAYNSDNMYVTFSGQDLSATLGGTQISIMNNFVYDGTTQTSSVLSQSFSFAQIQAAGGFTITNASSVEAYISYGSDVGFNDATAAPSPVTMPTRYSNMELTWTQATGGGGGADTTYITNFGGGLNLTSYTDTAETMIQSTRLIGTGTNVTTGQIFDNLASYVKNDQSGPTGSAIITQGSGSSATYTRIVMPTTYLNDIANGSNTAYPSFQPYVNQLISTYGTGSVATLGLIAPGASGTLSPAVAYVKNGSISDGNGDGYLYDLSYNNFQTTIASSGSGTATSYTITMTGTVNALYAGGPTSNTPAPTGSFTYSGLSMTVTFANAAALNAFIYSQATPTITTTGVLSNVPGVTYTAMTGSWTQFSNDFDLTGTVGPAVNFYQRIPGDLSEGLLVGAVGSAQPSGTTGVTIGQLNSAQWWNNPQLTYTTAQTGTFYNTLAAYLWSKSDGQNPDSSTFSSGGLYVNSFDDRYGQALMNLYGTNGAEAETEALNVWLTPDGDLTVADSSGSLDGSASIPEPVTWDLLGLGLVLLGIYAWRRQRPAATTSSPPASAQPSARP